MAVSGVFCTMGHGDDLVHNENRKKVPKGCTYVTIGLSGMTSIDLPKILYAFQDGLLKDALKFPDDEKIHSILTEYFRLPFDSPIRVHNEGDLYTDSVISLWTNVGHHYLKSGIYELGRPFPIGGPYFMNNYIIDKAGSIVMDRGRPKTIDNPRDAPDDLYKFVYKYSLWEPSERDNYNVSRHYSEIMSTYRSEIDHDQFPNLIFYHFACRTPFFSADPKVTEQVKLKRQQSINEIYRKGVYYQEGHPITKVLPTIKFSEQKAARVVSYFESWVTTWVHDPDYRTKWSLEIKEALDDIKKRHSSDMNTATSASAASAASSNQSYNPFRLYSGTASAAASVPFRSHFNMLSRNATPSSLLSSLQSMSLSSAAVLKAPVSVASVSVHPPRVIKTFEEIVRTPRHPHKLEATQWEKDRVCDVCNKLTDQTFYCSIDNYDECLSCYRLLKIVHTPRHPHKLEATQWEKDRVCDVCNKLTDQTFYCSIDNYDECLSCYRLSRFRPIAHASAASASTQSRKGGRRNKRKTHRKKSKSKA